MLLTQINKLINNNKKYFKRIVKSYNPSRRNTFSTDLYHKIINGSLVELYLKISQLNRFFGVETAHKNKKKSWTAQLLAKKFSIRILELSDKGAMAPLEKNYITILIRAPDTPRFSFPIRLTFKEQVRETFFRLNHQQVALNPN